MKISESGREGMGLHAREGKMQGEVEGAGLLDKQLLRTATVYNS